MHRVIPFAVCLAALVSLAAGGAPAAAAEHRFGLGVNYWRALDDVVADDFDLDEDGLAPYLTYQLRPAGLFSFEVNLEYFERGFGGSTAEAYSPQLYVLIGHGLYGGVGIGVTYSSDLPDDVSDPFYAARIGYVLTLVPRIHLDINLNYRAGTFDTLDEASSDTITLGAAVRFGL